MGSKVRPRQNDRQPKRFVPDYAPEKKASTNTRKASHILPGRTDKRKSNPRNKNDYDDQ